MNAKQLTAGVAIFALTASAFAIDGETFRNQKSHASTKTRAEVVAELTQARDQGLAVGGAAYVTPAVASSHRTRAEVRAEAIQAARNSSVNAQYFGS